MEKCDGPRCFSRLVIVPKLDPGMPKDAPPTSYRDPGMLTHRKGEVNIAKAYTEGQTWRASVRDTRHNEVMVPKRGN